MNRPIDSPGAAGLYDAAVQAYEAEDWASALRLALEALRQQPHPGALYLAGILELDAGQAASAAGRLELAAHIAPGHAGIRRSLGQAYAALERWPEAVAAYNDALRLGPADPGLLSDIGLALHEVGDWDSAVSAFEESLRLDPSDAGVYNNLAVTLNRKHDYTGAAETYRKGLALDPDNLDLLANFAMLQEQMNEVESAEEIALRGLELAPGHGILNLVAARCARRKGEPEQAIRRVEAALADPATPPQATRGLHFELGRNYDDLGDIERAFRHFSEGNRIAVELWPDMAEGGLQYLQELDATLAAYDETALRRLAGAAPAAADRSPAFLVGFPRSGTTLMDTLLGAHPDVAVMEEEQALHQVHEAMVGAHGRDPRALLSLSQAQLDELRALYWAEAAKTLGTRAGTARVVLDKNPFYSARMPLIHRLFPDARIIFALRHPCAVILSCFMQPFGRNPALANFTSLTGGAETYCRVMQLWLRARANLPLHCHELRYESLVEDKDAQLRATLDFLGLDWDETAADHVKHAQKRGRIYTPSYHQVSRPIYTDSVNRWRNYEAYFGEARALLDPFVAGFGYQP